MLRQILIAIDQLANALLGGYADETLSAHAHRQHPRLARLINLLFPWQDDHCLEAYQSERLRSQLPPEYR